MPLAPLARAAALAEYVEGHALRLYATVTPEDGQPGGEPWSADDCLEYFEERAAVATVHGGRSEETARAIAWRG